MLDLAWSEILPRWIEGPAIRGEFANPYFKPGKSE
jgi:hypothetical protein